MKYFDSIGSQFKNIYQDKVHSLQGRDKLSEMSLSDEFK